ncbi:hypothetical protein EFA46_015780 (plasmid) [Halarchaeum sp. CBA1220]|uniref:hypothetical protein n=1 Tax=Halarchaeum sp. CBA1220 TaxID=1853682 RepID=UPI0015A02BEB|nr:hypothetical protein [Halarchaeum sp. CBA1220]QLC35713.1 hypothetical protein EFA46_015780 [Halarchaeum sp. CBA1220]
MPTDAPNDDEEESPEPPAELANWVVDPLQSQSIPKLEHVVEYAEELIAYKSRPVSAEADSTDGEAGGSETVETLPQKEQSTQERQRRRKEIETMSKAERIALSDEELRKYGTVEIRKLDCGPGCKQCPHGPYRYCVYRNSKGTVTSKYAGKLGSE